LGFPIVQSSSAFLRSEAVVHATVSKRADAMAVVVSSRGEGDGRLEEGPGVTEGVCSDINGPIVSGVPVESDAMGETGLAEVLVDGMVSDLGAEPFDVVTAEVKIEGRDGGMRRGLCCVNAKAMRIPRSPPVEIVVMSIRDFDRIPVSGNHGIP
jgi:hypothetical protein